MHIPDGFLDTKTVVATAALSAGAVAFAVRQARIAYPQHRVPLLGLTAAFIFAAQMLNFPVAGGTSGHLMGGVLAAVLLGPAASVVAMSAVLVVQALVFADGGLLALGANTLNMAITAPVAGYAVYRAVCRIAQNERGRLAAVAFASWCSIVLASVLCAGELAWSGTVAWELVFPAMANVHMIIGAGEALITTLVVAALMRVRPDLFAPAVGPASSSRIGHLVVSGLIIVIAVVLFVSPFASPWPDGLERTAEALGFMRQGSNPAANASAEDYTLPGIGSPVAATALAGAVGTMAAFGLAFLLAGVVSRRRGAEDEA